MPDIYEFSIRQRTVPIEMLSRKQTRLASQSLVSRACSSLVGPLLKKRSLSVTSLGSMNTLQLNFSLLVSLMYFQIFLGCPVILLFLLFWSDPYFSYFFFKIPTFSYFLVLICHSQFKNAANCRDTHLEVLL